MTWINVIAYENATGRLKKLYDRVKGPDDNVDNIMLAHGLRPHTMEAHMTMYKYVLHHSANVLEKWYLEAIGVYVSWLNACHYCVDHHFEGLIVESADREKAMKIKAGFETGQYDGALTVREEAGLSYAGHLTRNPSSINESEIEKLRGSGFDDGEILEINQVTAYFNYANRTVLGLGITTRGDVLGLAPRHSENPDDWNHG